MRILNIVVNILVMAVLIAAALAGLACIPVVQNWLAGWAASEQSVAKISFDAFSAGFGKAEVDGLQMEVGGAVLSGPSFQAELPISTALWNRRFLVQKLVAKGWTLDLSRVPARVPAAESAEAAPETGAASAGSPAAQTALAQDVVQAFCGTLSRWTLPYDVTLADVDLEGDVLVPARTGSPAARVHVIVTGGGVAPGHEGTFAVAAKSVVMDPELSVMAFTAHGQITVGLQSARTFSRAEVQADLTAKGGPFPNPIAASVDIAVARGAGEEIYGIQLNRGGRTLVKLAAQFPEATHQLAGTWQVDVQDSDMSALGLDLPGPHYAAKGGGRFDTDVAFGRVHGLGHLSGTFGGLGVLASALEPIGTATYELDFDAVHRGHILDVDRVQAAMTSGRAAAGFRALQAFEVDETTGAVQAADPAQDSVGVTLRGIPMSWLTGLTGDFVLAGGEAAGAFTVRAARGAYAVRSEGPVTVAGLAVRRGAATLGQRLAVSLGLRADYAATGWRIDAAPVSIGCDGRRLATLDAKVNAVGGADHPVAITASWTADLQAIASQDGIPGFRGLGGRTASGDFSATLGEDTTFDTKLSVVGRDEHNAIAASLHADADGHGTVTFHGPVRIASGPNATELSAEGSWIQDEDGNRVYVNLTGKQVVLEQLRLLTAGLAVAGGRPLGRDRSAGVRDAAPFWGTWTGHVGFDFDQVKAVGRTFDAVAGMIQVVPGALHLDGGRGGLGTRKVSNAAGTLTFDANSPLPYSLTATASVDQLEAASYFPAPRRGDLPIVSGHFAVAGTLRGKGINLDDLAARLEEEFQFTSQTGIVRVLQTDVAEAVPPDKASVKDDLGSVGSAFGSVFGLGKKSPNAGAIKVDPVAEAVLDFTYDVAEIGCDQITIKAVRSPDGAVRITNLELVAPDEHITGSGLIEALPGRSLRERPFSMNWQFAAHGRVAKYLNKAHLLSPQKDGRGFFLLPEPIHLGGTLAQIDTSQWHDMLAQAVARSADASKKAAP